MISAASAIHRQQISTRLSHATSREAAPATSALCESCVAAGCSDELVWVGGQRTLPAHSGPGLMRTRVLFVSGESSISSTANCTAVWAVVILTEALLQKIIEMFEAGDSEWPRDIGLRARAARRILCKLLSASIACLSSHARSLTLVRVAFLCPNGSGFGLLAAKLRGESRPWTEVGQVWLGQTEAAITEKQANGQCLELEGAERTLEWSCMTEVLLLGIPLGPLERERGERPLIS